MDDKLIYIPNDDEINNPFCKFRLLVKKFYYCLFEPTNQISNIDCMVQTIVLLTAFHEYKNEKLLDLTKQVHINFMILIFVENCQ